MLNRLALFAVVSAMLGVGSLANAACIDVRQKEPLAFKGTLNYRIFPGPPNYEDVKKGDKPEAAYIIKLDTPICAAGDEFLGGNETIDQIQLLMDDSSQSGRTLWQSLRQMDGKRVAVSGKSGFGAQTGHHHAPLLMTLVGITAN
jgi:Domain of unknown function (DUF4431)